MGHPRAGITNRPPDNAIFASLAFSSNDAASTRAAVDQLRELLRDELRSMLANTTPESDKSQRSAETGELGFDDGDDRHHLTVTVGFSNSGYDALRISEDQQLQDLEATRGSSSEMPTL
jgi:deferrochelatase/peroxidase EfeB